MRAAAYMFTIVICTEKIYNKKIDINSAGIREEYYEVYRLADRRTGI